MDGKDINLSSSGVTVTSKTDGEFERWSRVLQMVADESTFISEALGRSIPCPALLTQQASSRAELVELAKNATESPDAFIGCAVGNLSEGEQSQGTAAFRAMLALLAENPVDDTLSEQASHGDNSALASATLVELSDGRVVIIGVGLWTNSQALVDYLCEDYVGGLVRRELVLAADER